MRILGLILLTACSSAPPPAKPGPLGQPFDAAAHYKAMRADLTQAPPGFKSSFEGIKKALPFTEVQPASRTKVLQDDGQLMAKVKLDWTVAPAGLRHVFPKVAVSVLEYAEGTTCTQRTRFLEPLTLNPLAKIAVEVTCVRSSGSGSSTRSATIYLGDGEGGAKVKFDAF